MYIKMRLLSLHKQKTLNLETLNGPYKKHPSSKIMQLWSLMVCQIVQQQEAINSKDPAPKTSAFPE